ncbi:MAG: response regulator [Desulfosudaceae bacterium]
MNENQPSLTILMAEDDPDDRFLVQEAFNKSGIAGTLQFVNDGEQLVSCLLERDSHAALPQSPFSCLLLDLNMPRKDGREALREIRRNSAFQRLQIVVLTTSDSADDRQFCHDLGVSEYITKPDNFIELVALMNRIETICETPPAS